ncbi:hypothetical protein IV203_003310 [Nitzschia inconspicua]|uniref:Uncharacterized protein n=1 Tax=Nitzschia inconspicua TaxID=303405 RepID=A0A9K3PQX5_9STRA|nr:hypothetical protein IV203_003310 [Nitzschia inconspicua]
MPSKQDEIASKFASLLGTKGVSVRKDSVASSLVKSDPKAMASRELLLCLSKSIENHEVICTLPSLDMRKLDEDTGSISPLPKVGEHFQAELIQKGMSTDKTLPQMEASVLHNAADASAKAAQVEQKAAQSLGAMTSWTKSSLVYAPTAISENAANSFSSLVDSRVRAWTLLLLRHSLTTGDSASRSRLLSMLSSIIKVNSAETAFKTLPLPESAAQQPKEADVILPLLLEVDLQISIQSQDDVVTLRAPGTISANFDRFGDPLGSGLKNADIRLDTGALLDSMVQQARMVVFKAVAKATSVSEGMQLEGSKVGGADPILPSSQLSGFSSALNLSNTGSVQGNQTTGSSTAQGSHKPAHRLQKAKTSALKLGSVLATPPLSGGNAVFDKSKKTRSVQWDARMELNKSKNSSIPSPKRQKMATTARLTSFKSFGRPHAGDFGSGPKNATFGDFGRKPIWGRDGRMANKPSPMMPAETTDMLTSQVRQTANATFDFPKLSKPSIHLSSVADLGIKAKNTAAAGGSGRTSSVIPRTATAHEALLIQKFGGGF